MTARCSHLMFDGGNKWPVGLSRPFANVGPLLRYTRGECACTVAGPRPGLVGPAVHLAVLNPTKRGACPGTGLKVSAAPLVLGRPTRWSWPRKPRPGRCFQAAPYGLSGTDLC